MGVSALLRGTSGRYFVGSRQGPLVSNLLLPTDLCDKKAMHAQKLLIRICLCCLPVLAMAQKVSPDEAKVLDAEKRWTDAYKQHSVSMLTSLLAEDCIITVEDGRSFGKIGYMSHTTDSSVQVDVAEESDVKVRLHGNVAVVTGAYHEAGISKGKRYEYRDRFTDVWMKTEGQWLLIASHYSIPAQT
ncbi:MAG TPA: nuclear transport factor 2 family protein [Candidatus Angelobacter sp.]|nr:nuclear transport factor 2 family protein [Candidatus Angelobacter sp.]